jgi:WD40 repeat protein
LIIFIYNNIINKDNHHMDYDKLYSYIQSKLFTDVSLTLIDKSHSVTFDAHKAILSASCLYFEKLFTVLKEKDLNSITIEVPNAHVAYDMIMLFYGQKSNLGMLSVTKHLLESLRCYYFFGLDFDQSFLDDIDVFMDIVDMIGYDERIIRLINKNLPETYDLSKFPKELLDEMLSMAEIHHIIFGNSDGYVEIHDVKTNKLVKTLNNNHNLRCMACSPNNKFIACGCDDDDIKVWDIEMSTIIHILTGHTDEINTICYSPDSKYIASGGDDQCIKIWDALSGELISDWDKCNAIIMSLCYSSTGNKIAAGLIDGPIIVYDAETFDTIISLSSQHNQINSVRFSHDDLYIVSGGEDELIQIWNWRNGEKIHTIQTKTIGIWDASYSMDDKYIVSGGAKSNVQIWDAHTGKFISTLVGDKICINSISYSPDNKFIIGGGNNIKIWDSQTGELVNDFGNHMDVVSNVYYMISKNNPLINRIKEINKN